METPNDEENNDAKSGATERKFTFPRLHCFFSNDCDCCASIYIGLTNGTAYTTLFFCSYTHLAGRVESMCSRGFPLPLRRTQLSHILLTDSLSRHTCNYPKLTNRSKRPLETYDMSSLTIQKLSGATTRVGHHLFLNIHQRVYRISM